MVKELGMSEKVGLRTHESQSNELMSVNDLSPALNEIIDIEIKKIMQVKIHTLYIFFLNIFVVGIVSVTLLASFLYFTVLFISSPVL